MAVNVTINTNIDQDNRLEKIRLLQNSQGQNYLNVDAMAKAALIQKVLEWEETADIDEFNRVLDAYKSGTINQRTAVRNFMNKAPSFVLSGDTEVAVNEQAQLLADWNDDGLPNGIVTFLWELVSGPGNATFDTTTNANTDVSFNAQGGYVVRFNIDDGDKSDFAEIGITVF